MSARLSPFGVLLAGAAGFLLLGAFLFTRPVLAFVGLAFAVGLTAARSLHEETGVQVTMRTPGRAQIGQRVRIVATALSSSPLALRVRIPLSTGFEEIKRTSHPGRARAQEVLVAVPVSPGALALLPVVVEAGDRWGLWQKRVHVETNETVQVAPETRWSVMGARRGKRNSITKTVANRWATETGTLVRTVRGFQVGDRLRDVDWPRSARGLGLFTRERERVTLRPVIVMLDATHTMRWVRRHSKLKTASRIALAVMSAASGAGARTGLVVFTDHEVHKVQALGGPGGVNKTLQRMGTLPRPENAESGDDTEMEPDKDAAWTMEGGDLRPVGSPPVAAALAKVAELAGGPGLVVLVLDGESAPRRTRVILERLLHQGHDVVLVVPATGAHHYLRREAKKGVLQELGRLQGARGELIRLCQRHRVPFFVVDPEGERAIVEGVSRWPR